ncbi:SAP domain-containing protein [Paenibacillus massiliensis]|uniref:SAP domain-containing protein n=1 Tax=Paenibacillus massiliensis TaxID=225917 RepID=UPI0004717B1F|nr:SAP domain-containing protein [Paenibacillus massiliensis]
MYQKYTNGERTIELTRRAYEVLYVHQGFKPVDGDQDIPDKPIEDMTVPQLKAYAKLHDIDITGKTAKPEILAAIQAVTEGGGNDGNDQAQGQTV